MKISLIELLVKGIPEGFLVILALHIFTGVKIDLKKYLMMSVLYIVLTYFVRYLPINYGVNTLLSLLILVVFAVLFYRVELSRAIKSTIVIVIMLFGCEIINVLGLIVIVGDDMANELLSDSFTKSIYSIPSTVLLAVLTFVIRYFIKLFEKRRKVKDGKSSAKNS